ALVVLAEIADGSLVHLDVNLDRLALVDIPVDALIRDREVVEDLAGVADLQLHGSGLDAGGAGGFEEEVPAADGHLGPRRRGAAMVDPTLGEASGRRTPP